MSKFIEIDAAVPVKPHLLKFVLHKENLQAGQSLDLKPGTVITNELKSILTNKKNIDHEKEVAKGPFSEYTAILKFKVGYRMQAYSCFFLSREGISHFNNFLHNLFHEILLDRIRYGMKSGKTEKEIIYDFMRELDIEDDISFDAVKKASYRLRKSKKIDHFYQHTRRSALIA